MRKVLSTIAAMALLATTMIGGAAVSAADETNIKDVTVLRRTPLITELNTIAQSLKEGETSTLFEIEAGGERGDYFPYGEGTEPVFQLYGGSYAGTGSARTISQPCSPRCSSKITFWRVIPFSSLSLRACFSSALGR